MAGTVGMDEVVRTYLKVEMLSELQEDKAPISQFMNRVELLTS